MSPSDNCVFTKIDNYDILIIVIWVDDILVAGSNDAMINDLKDSLSQKFKMKNFGQIKDFLGIQFEFTENGIKMHQSKYIEKILSKFQMDDCNPKYVPCDLSTSKIDFVDSEPFENVRLYREIVGSLVYLMTCTRPDLSYVVTKLSECLEKPTHAHYALCKYVLRYLKGSIDKGLMYYKNREPYVDIDLIGFSDSDWGSAGDRKSLTGYCFKLYDCDSFVSWKTKKQPTVALSTCEAEYLAITHAMQEGLFLRQILIDLKCKQLVISLFVDNRGAIDLAHNPVHHRRTKHVDIRYHFIRSKIQSGLVKISHVASNDNLADLFTKPSPKCNLSKFYLY